MSKHSTTPRTLSRRLAALLAALALLAAMALPVYAAALDDATQMQETVETDNNGETDNKVETGSDVETDDKSETNEGTGVGADTDSNDTNDNASSSTTGDSNTTADDAVNDTPQTLPTDNTDTTADKTTMDNTLDTMDEDAEQDILTRSADDAEESHITQMLAAQTSDSSFEIYFAVPTKFAINNYTGVNLNYQKSDGTWPGMMPMRLLQSRDYLGRKVYEITINPEECPEYFQEVQFHYVDANGNTVSDAGKFEKLSGYQYRKNIANKLYDADSRKWESFTPYDPNNHQTFAGKSMTFENLSNESLTNVKALFYELDSANNGALTPVATVEIGNVDTNKRKPFAIPDAACSYIKFTAEGKDDLSGTYNFYGQGNANQFIYNENTKYCFTYCASDASAWGTSQGSTTIYFDATLSKLTYNKDKETEAKVAYGMPTADNKLWYYAKFADGTTDKGTMTQDGTNSDGNIWYVSFTDKTPVSIRFAAWDVENEVAAGNGDGTAMLNVPHNLEQPCFYADTSDAAVYKGGNRDGYWDELGQTRDAAKGKNATVVDVEPAEFTKDGKTKYISSTLYDYYSDWELNGNNRDVYSTDYGEKTFANNRNWVTFRQFDQALSDYYSQSGTTVNYPMYTGQFQPDAADSNGTWGLRFSDIASTLNLYGYANTKTFMAVNNSTSDINGNGLAADQTKLYDETFQGLAGSELKNGEPIMNGTTDLAMPFFNEEFLQSENSKKTKLGEVYKDVSFPFTQEEVFKESDDATAYEKGVMYWYFDSDKTTLYLKKDTGDEGYFLQRQSSLADNSKNLLSNSMHAQVNNKDTYGFFPFNSKSKDTKASTYNYGFGAKLQFQFTLTSDGKVKDNSGREVPIKFFFSGDDDVWVYIDDKLALDVGGDHGKASGLLEFGADNNGNNYTSYVSDIKESNNTVYDSGAGKTVTYLGNKITFNYKSKQTTTLKPGTHTLTMFYMERGMWESNMAVAFNFPDHNELQVEKQVDVTGVNKLFKDSFQNQKIFTFNIQNLATHYAAKDTSYKEGETKALPEDAYKKAEKPSDASAKLEYVEKPPKSQDGDLAVLWSATMDDPTSKYRKQRRGTLSLNEPIDIRQYSYLTFDVYVKSKKGNESDTCALGNLYVELWDTKGNQKGCLGTKGLQSSDVYGAATALHPGQWYTIRLLLKSLETSDDFNNYLKYIKVGDNFAREIYLRNFTFRSAPKEQTTTGFTTEQYNIPDYGSAATGTLQNAAYAVFSSDRGNGDIVDEDGQFLLQDGETVTFKDQFRRGSYIALKEVTDSELYDTSWTVYENGEPVTTLKDVPGTAPKDDRTEPVIEGTDNKGNPIKNKYVSPEQKPNDNTLVFRSYSGTADKDELTKLKVVFTNKVKTGKLIIHKELAPGEILENQEFTFTVKFSDVGGQGLGNEIKPQTYICTVKRYGDKCYGDVVIDKIPVGTRFVVSEDAHKDTNLQSVSITGGGTDCAVTEDGKRVRGAIAEGDNNAVTATFVNTSRQLIDIEVTKQWKKQNGTTDIPSNELPKAIYLQLQRTETPKDETSWKPVPGYDSVELKPVDYEGWTKLFTGLDKYDANKPEVDRIPYTYRVLESASETGDWHGGADDNVIEIDGKKYTILNNTVQVEKESTSPLALNLTNQLQDAKYNLVITKQDAQDITKKLGGVEFTLEKLGTDGKLDKTFATVTKITSSEDTNKGECRFEDLTPGSYRLTETKTAEGYTLLADAIEFTLKTDGHCVRDGADFGKVQYDSGTGMYNIALTINNRKSFELPHTGADAPSLWLLIGLPLAVAGLLILVFRYNKKGGRTR